jgi:glycosyltransferase involved in cell wall biosynthesis
MKKVLIVSNEFPPDIGGAGSYAFDLANVLSKKNYKVTVVTKKNKERKFEKNKFKLIEVKTYPKIRFWNLWNNIKKINLEEFQYIFLNDIGANQVGSFFFNKKLRNKTICLLHGSEPEIIYNGKNKFFLFIKYSKWYTKLLKECFKIIAVSKDMKNKFIEISKLKELEDKIKISNNGVNINKFYPDEINLYKKYNIPKDNKLILSVSRIEKLKGYDNKLSILEKLEDEFENFTWIIVGDGNYLKKLKNKVRKSKISNKVIFVGKINRGLLKKYYSSVDLFFLLSEYRESYGLVYLEANACGCPVIGNKYGGVKEIIVDGVNGYCIDNYDHQLILKKIINILKDSKFNKNKIIEYAYKNRIEKTVGRIIKIIEA